MKYSEDPAWADVVKVPQDDGPNPIVSIAYSAEFTDVMDCFRGVLKLNEYSERTLALTLDVIDVNPANYTVWIFRRRVLQELGSDLHQELQFTADMAIQHPKNYQIWHHRREICSMLHDGSAEKDFCALAITEDSKNYHAWAHRQWAIKTFALWDGEIEFVDKMLLEDIRNNSAWNHRWFVHSNTLGFETIAMRQQEIEYALDKIALAVHNESPWNYLRGLIRNYEAAFAAHIKEKAHAILQTTGDCIFAAALLVDLYAKEGTDEAREIARKLATTLMKETDHIRKAYWQYRLSTLKQRS